jgi:putative membrane protein
MLFYLPRLFVYHHENKNTQDFVKIVQIQEYKLYKYIGYPAMIATIFSGAFLAYINSGLFQSGFWLYVKIFFVVLMTIYSYSLEHFRIKLKENNYPKNIKFFRYYNEIPTILAIVIIIMVIIRPL